jgi:alpha-N-arabinofuranosidase
VDAWQWRPDLIWMDNLRVVGTPSYYVQQLFSRNRGDAILPIDTKAPSGSHFYASAVRDLKANETIVKVVNANSQPLEAQINLSGADVSGRGTATVLTSEKITDENSLAEPLKVSPRSEWIRFSGAAIQRVFPAHSLTVLRIPTRHPPTR